MIRRHIRGRRLAIGPAAFLILTIAFLGGCAVKTLKPWGDPSTGLILKYRMPEGQILKYHIFGEQVESTEVQGQTIVAETKGDGTYSFKSQGLKEGNHQLEVTVDAVSLQVSAMQRDLSPDMSPLVGKSFTMILSPLGQEVDVSGAEALQFQGTTGKRSLASRFQALFPNLAERPLRVGDSWTSRDRIEEKGESSKVTIEVENLSTVEGFETVGGLECARIKTEVTGRLEGGGSQSGAEFTISGNFKGLDTWYFAYREGLFVRLTSTADIDAIVDVTSPQVMSIPTKQEMKEEIILVKD